MIRFKATLQTLKASALPLVTCAKEVIEETTYHSVGNLVGWVSLQASVQGVPLLDQVFIRTSERGSS